MPVTISVKGDLTRVRAQLTGMAKQVRFATAKALTDTARDVQRAEQAEMAQVFDRPAAFTVRQGIGITPATKINLTAVVFLKRKQAEYLQAQIAGGVRRRKPFEAQFARDLQTSIATAVPGSGITTNAQGNVSKATITRLARQAKGKSGNVFAAKLNSGTSGIFERAGRGLKPLLIFTDRRASYRQRFDFYGVGRRTVARTFNRNFERAMQFALRTAR